MKHGNVFGSDARTYDASSMPVWISVDEQKLAGGTIDVSKNKRGDLIPLGIPVRLDKMGGTVVILDAFEVVTSTTTSVTLKKGIYGTVPVQGMILGKIDAAGVATKAAALGTTTDNSKFTITSDALGTLSPADKLYVIAEAGDSKPAVLPNGLSRRDIYIDTDAPTVATVAVVTKGQILADRIPEMPDIYKNALTGITFEHEL